MKFPLYQHQKDALEKAKGQEHFAYFMEMGTGKTPLLLADAERSYNENDIECLLILAPKGVYRNWTEKEIPTHLSVPHEIFTWSSSLTENQQGNLDRSLFRADYRLKIFVLNIESLISKRSLKISEKVLKTYRTMLVIDESTAIKNPLAQRTKVTLQLAELAAMRRILTGSPITKSPYDMFSQSEFLKPKLLGFSSFLNFRHYYAIIEKGYSNAMVMRWNPETKKREMMRATYEKIVGYKNLDQLNERIQPWSFRCLKKDCLDLPAKVYMTRDIEVTPEQAKAYNSMKDQWIMEVGEASCTASIALVKSLKMHQILCGHVKNDLGEMLTLPQKRTETLLNVLEESSDQKVLIFVKYRQDAINVRKELDEIYGEEATVEFHGGVSDNDRKLAKERIQNDPTCHFFIGSKAACEGITLTACTLVIFYSYDYDRHSWKQGEDRVHRIGMTSCTILHLKVAGSIDETILASHEAKGLISDQIIERQIAQLSKL